MTDMFFSSIQQKGESVENFYGRLGEAENWSLGDEETTLIRDILIWNMLDFKTQEALIEKTVSSTKALEITTHMAMGAQNQQKINQILNTDTESVNIVNLFQNHNRTTNYQQQSQSYNRNTNVPNNYQQTSLCEICAQCWT